MFPIKVVSVSPKLPEAICRLKELAYDFCFSWKAGGVEIYRSISPELWRASGHNPVRFLMHAREEDMEAAARDEVYMAQYNRFFEMYDRYLASENTWFARRYPEHRGKVIAYFSAEFGLHESHPIYSGGLGLLAGDHCKSASDLGLPFIGVGLLYKHGYFDQRIDSEGRQEAVYPHLNFYELPITPVNNADGSQLAVAVEMPGRTVHLQVWLARVGRVTIYLLDADNTANTPEDRRLTGQLYGGDAQYRLSQEILLGIGGVRALRALGIDPHVWHINEGHAAFLIVERVRELMRYGISLATAREVVRASTVFTTHTPVPAGHDLFAEDLIVEYFVPFIEHPGVGRKAFLELAWDDGRAGFNMTLLALRHSCLSNGVSRLHGRVAREMFRPHYSSLHPEEIPITSITNGVHIETWLAWEYRELFSRCLGKNWADEVTQRYIWEKLDQVPDQELWKIHRFLKEKLIAFVRASIKQQRVRNLEPVLCINEAEEYLNPDILLVGFARRFAAYKRAALLLNDLERLSRLLNNPDRPVRFVFAGKSHPADLAGQELIREINRLSKLPEFRGKLLILENYDIHMARHLVQGVDAWLNTPRRPMEASGTSGMKAAINGLINISTLDGWWPEAYNGDNGFAVGSENEYGDAGLQDRDDSHSLYRILEDRLIPMYYHKESGIPMDWVRMMKNSIKSIAPVFNTHRMVAEYTYRFYVPALERGLHYTAGNNQVAAKVSQFKEFVTANWNRVGFVTVRSSGKPKMLVSDKLEISAVLKLGPFLPEDVLVEVVYGEVLNNQLKNIATIPMQYKEEVEPGNWLFSASLVLPQGFVGYTVRVLPGNHEFSPGELPLVTWAPGF